MKRIAILVICGLLAGCGDKGPSNAEIEGAVMSRMEQQYTEAVQAYGAAAAEWHVIPPQAVKVVSIDNIRSQDDATYLADVTLERVKTGVKDTRPLSLRMIEGAWRVVSQ
ncbi:lipoprotein [Agrobacterium tumefaciens]|uniref:lipoprotein n=1 Tax=Agrobacterium tumefaciens TaxID=358 RepID=UPI00157494A1|nr:lipoprotein [Agrobacterium tumefaciens]NSX94400.1 lipoprotein [Agrobacterium tumefaciens]